MKKKYWLHLGGVSLTAFIALLVIIFRPEGSRSVDEKRIGKNINAKNDRNLKRSINRNSDKKNISQKPAGEEIFKIVKLSSSELESFYSRRYEPRELTLHISGLTIDRRPFTVDKAEELPERLQIPLPGGKGVKEFIRQRVDFRNRTRFVWVGRATDNKLDEVHLSFYRGAIVGGLQTQKGTYQIKRLSSTKEIIREVDNRQYPKLVDDVVLPGDEEARSPGDREAPSARRERDEWPSFPRGIVKSIGQQSDEVNVVVDVVAGYSHLIESIEGGEDAALAVFAYYISIANTTHENSQTGVRINATDYIKLDNFQERNIARAIDKLKRADEDRLGAYDAGNPYHFLINKRHQTKSDVTILFLHTHDSSACGRAYLMSRWDTPSSYREKAISVVGADCQDSVVAHEVGHNMGCHHNREDAAETDVLLPYAYGFRTGDEEARGFRTTMAYSCSGWFCPQINYFSNPDQSYNGITMGAADTENNVKVIRKRAWVLRDIYTSTDVPEITQQPQGGTITDGNFLTLTVVAAAEESNPILEYQWYRDGDMIIGETDASLILNSLSYSGDSTNYYVKILNKHGWASSQKAEVIFARDQLQITEGPKGGRVLGDTPLTLNVTATSLTGGTLAYQWYRDETALSGATSSHLTLTSFSHTKKSAKYYVEVSTTVSGNDYIGRSDKVKVTFLNNYPVEGGQQRCF